MIRFIIIFNNHQRTVEKREMTSTRAKTSVPALVRFERTLRRATLPYIFRSEDFVRIKLLGRFRVFLCSTT